jgi:hypothetical protein
MIPLRITSTMLIEEAAKLGETWTEDQAEHILCDESKFIAEKIEEGDNFPTIVGYLINIYEDYDW